MLAKEDPFIVTLKNAIINCGHTVNCCHNIEETHEAFKKINYDLVFIDCRRASQIHTNNSKTNLPPSAPHNSNSNPSLATSSTPQTNTQYDYENICRYFSGNLKNKRLKAKFFMF